MMQLTKAGTSDVVVINSISKRAFDSDIIVRASSKGGPPGYFKKGYGIFVMQEIERIFSDAKELYLDTPVCNIRTNAFYQKLGYIVYKKEDEIIYYSKKINNG